MFMGLRASSKWRPTYHVSEYRGVMRSKYALSSYLDRYILLTTWNGRFKFRTCPFGLQPPACPSSSHFPPCPILHCEVPCSCSTPQHTSPSSICTPANSCSWPFTGARCTLADGSACQRIPEAEGCRDLGNELNNIWVEKCQSLEQCFR